MVTYRKREETNRIIIHDSHTTTEIEDSVDVLRWQGRAMGLLDVGYHFVLPRMGGFEEVRDHEAIGSHAPGHNLDSIGICLLGGREMVLVDEKEREVGIDNFTFIQRHELIKGLAWLTVKYPEAEVKGHSEIQRYHKRGVPACPCLDMDELRNDLELFKLEGVLL